MAVVLVLACLAVLAAVVALAMGRGGELSATHRDLPPLPPSDDRPFLGPEPFALPRGFWGYQVEMTDQAMARLRHALYERDLRTAALERRLTELRRRLRETDATPEPDGEPLPDGKSRIDGEPRLDGESRIDGESRLDGEARIDGVTRVDLVKNNASGGDRPGGDEAHS